MRKFLLFAFAAALTISASAQTVKDKVLARSTVNAKNLTLDITAPSKISFGKQVSKVAKKAPARIAHDGIYGLYVYSSTDFSLQDPGCDSLLIEKESATIEGVSYALDTKITMCHETMPFVIYGKYDAEAGTITCPTGQYVAEYINKDEGIDYNIWIFPWVGENLDDAVSSNDDIVFDVDADGIITLSEGQLGICYRASQNGQDLGNWNNRFDYDIRPANSVISYKIATNKKDADGKTIYQDCASAAYVEDFQTAISVFGYAAYPNVSGFALSCVANMTVDTESKLVTYQAGQNVWKTQVLGLNDDNTGDWFKTYGITPDPENPTTQVILDQSENATVLGQLSGNQIQMDPQPVFTNLWNDPATGQLSGYGMWLEDLTITLDEGNFQADAANGIADVNAQKNVKAGKTFNVFGQEVPAATKGLVIRDGKKFYNK